MKEVKRCKQRYSRIYKLPTINSNVILKIGEVSKRNGIGIEALRFYEKSGLLDKPERTDSGYRMYDAKVERLAFIKRRKFWLLARRNQANYR